MRARIREKENRSLNSSAVLLGTKGIQSGDFVVPGEISLQPDIFCRGFNVLNYVCRFYIKNAQGLSLYHPEDSQAA